MSVCLSPKTKDPARLEKLVNVPPGTAVRLAVLEAEQKVREAPLTDYRDLCRSQEDHFYPALEAEPDVDTYHHFRLFGWGRVQDGTYAALGIVDETGTDDGDWNAGDCTDPGRCRLALAAQAIYSLALSNAIERLGVDEVFSLSEGMRWG